MNGPSGFINIKVLLSGFISSFSNTVSITVSLISFRNVSMLGSFALS
ncbi:hypothetical protein MCHI_003620 [Candidatus Magnetoovum chiemensis]|nr:hypothetical protein MCHI_003620 [Candidatus Magnetoovum chiemensis]